MEEYNEQEVARTAWGFLRSNSTCTLRFGENMQDMAYVIAPSGELVISAMVAMLQPCDNIMYVPDYGDDCMEMHVSLNNFLKKDRAVILQIDGRCITVNRLICSGPK